MREELRKAIADSLYVHFPLKPESDRSIERVNEAKDVQRSVKVWDGHDMSRWTFDGEGEALAEDGSLKCHTYPRSDHWPDSEVRADDAANGFYATFGSFIPLGFSVHISRPIRRFMRVSSRSLSLQGIKDLVPHAVCHDP